MQENFDVVIVGGAVMGSSTAFHLAQNPDFTGSILVIDKDMTYQRAASALSGSSIRQQYSTSINIRVSLYGIGFLRAAGEILAIDGEKPELGLKERGYLYLASEAGAGLLRDNNELQRGEGADIALMDAPALAQKFPWMKTEDVTLGSFGVTGEGWFDGYGLMQAFRRKARHLGVAYRQAQVTDLMREGSRITGVVLADGTRIGCGTLVDMAGASGARVLAQKAGVPIPVYAKKRSVFQFTAAARLDPFPLMIDISGVWCRPEGEGFLAGVSPDDLDETDVGTDFEVDWPQFEDIVWPALAHRVPAFENIRQGRAWAGHYDMCLFDHNAIVGPLPGLDNMLLAAGFSGHGLQQSPAVGRGVAELVVYGRYTTLDLSDFAYGRIAAQRPILERNVI